MRVTVGLLLFSLALVALTGCHCGDESARTCATNENCAGGQVCRDGRCVADPCGGGCPAGQYCSAEAGCQSCTVDRHCGASCTNCAEQTTNKACVGGICGCDSDADCALGQQCVDNFCSCTPDCEGKCGGASDGCDGSCTDACPLGQWCADLSCTDCTVDDHCGKKGETCRDCTALSNNKACVNRSCGCRDDGDCAPQEICRCAPPCDVQLFTCQHVDCTAGSQEACGPCDSGNRTCQADGTWGECEGASGCIPGTTETCGNCGELTCQDNCAWSSCTGEGCKPGSTRTCGNCNKGEQTCNDSCRWGSCHGEGACTPNETGDCCLYQCGDVCCEPGQKTCGSDCSWGQCG